MNTELKNIKPGVILLSFLAVVFLISACRSTSKFGGKINHKKNLVSWEVVFEKNTSDEEKYKAISRLEKYIIGGLYKENPEILLSYLKFTRTVNVGKDRQAVLVAFNIGYSSTNSVSTVIPPKGPPKREVFQAEISPFIQEINDRRQGF